MDGDNEFRFRISAYTPTTMPLGRLAEYLAELAKILGEDQAIHLIELEESSTVLVHKIDNEAVPKIRDRAMAVQEGRAPADAMKSFRRVNKMLRDDNGAGALLEGVAEILEFPGNRAVMPPYMSVAERGEIDGEVVRIGGMGDPVPILLSTEGRTVSGCWARRSIAKPLAQRLFEPVRLFGEGRWVRSPLGQWTLSAFRIDSFKELDDEPLSEIVNKLRGLPGVALGDNVIAELLAERQGDSNGGL
ncbi:MAG: hypothetical protein ACYC8V_03525 [Caulobacteraceae bacterium]